jgi:radical SAM superfamily enzyme YgiQ (UPF0313 family)
MKVVLALAPVWESITPPLALAFLKGSLKQAGYECRCIDFSVQFRPMMVSALGDWTAEDHIASRPALYKGWAKQICDEKPDIVGFSLLTSNNKNTALIAKEVKRMMPHVIIVSGGPSLTRENQDNLERTYEFSDYIIEGEGEQALVDFVKCIEQKEDVSKLKQMWLKAADGSLTYTGLGVEQPINAIPLPDFTDFDRSAYPVPGRLPMLFSRGCILNCNYCENKWNHLTQRSRLGSNVFEELKRNVREYGITEYMFNDDSLISFKTFKQLEEYCDLTIAEGLVMPWSVYGTRVERMLTEPYVQKLRRSGMERVSLGVESFSTKIQKEMGKSSKYDDADKTCRLFADQGIKTESWIIYGYPTETDEDFDSTLQWFVKNPNVLSHVTANAFGPNAKYLHDRPNVISFGGRDPWDWAGPGSTVEKRKERFLLLIEVLESIRQSRKGNFTYHVGDPLYVRYFSSWGRRERTFLTDRWAEMEGMMRGSIGLMRIFVKLGIAQEEWLAPPRGKQAPKEQMLLTEIPEGPAEELLDTLLARLSAQIVKETGSEDPDRILMIRQKISEVALLFDGAFSTHELCAMSLREPNSNRLLRDLSEFSADELVQRVLLSVKPNNANVNRSA